MLKGVSLVKLIEPPCTERYARWCERSVGEIIAYLLLDHVCAGQRGQYFLYFTLPPEKCATARKCSVGCRNGGNSL